jgi:transcription elongation factor GreA
MITLSNLARLDGGHVIFEGLTTMDKYPLTPNGLKNLQDELEDLKKVQRPNVIAAIAEARAHGDLSENAEYHAAREQQSFIEGRIQELEAVTSKAQVIDPSQFKGEKTVKFGAKVEIVDEETDEEFAYQIVGDYETDTDIGKISMSSPIARALIGKCEGDSVHVHTPKGRRDYEILSVAYAA